MNQERYNKYLYLESKANEGMRIALQQPTPDETFATILEYLGKSLRSERVYIFELNAEGNSDNTYEWVADGVTPEKDSLQNVPAEICAGWYHMFQNNNHVMIENIEDIRLSEPDVYDTLKRQNIQSVVAVPMYLDGHIIGFYGVDNPPMEDLEYASDLLQIMGHFLSSTIRRRNLVNELQYASHHDHLTGLGNRSYFSSYLQKHSHVPGLICMSFDLNNLKLCNDRYGHPAGDRLIQDAAECIQEAFGCVGKCFRVGGDEFQVIILDGTETDVQTSLRKLDAAVFRKNLTRQSPLSIAYGYGILEDGEDIEHLLSRCDEKMYEMKYRMKEEFPVYCQERIQNYLSILDILSTSTDDYLFMLDIAKDENWFFGNIDKNYALRSEGQRTNTTEEMLQIVYPEDQQKLREDLQKISDGTSSVHNMSYRWVNREGKPVWINCRGKVITDDKGKPFVMIGRVSDTALKYMINPLTGMFNENKLMLDIKNEHLLDGSGHLMLVRVSDLSRINEEKGWSHGDWILMNLSETLSNLAGSYPIFHVENVLFALFLKDMDAEQAAELSECIRQQVAERYPVVISAVSYADIPTDKTGLYHYSKQILTHTKSTGETLFP